MPKLIDILNFVTSLGGKAPKNLTRLFRYAGSGLVAVTIDYSLLLLMVEGLRIYYLIAAGISFLSAHTVNYLINRSWGFKDSKTSMARGYFLFIFFGVLGVLTTVLLMRFLVENLRIFYFVARVIASLAVGFINFLLNYFITFQMKGK